MSHVLLRVGNGENFRNSKAPFWAICPGKHNQFKTCVTNTLKGGIVWFITSNEYGGFVIGVAEFVKFCDTRDEPHTPCVQGWKGEENWFFQIHYRNLYDIHPKKLPISACIQNAGFIFDYEKVKGSVQGDLYEHYKHLKMYAEPRRWEVPLPEPEMPGDLHSLVFSMMSMEEKRRLYTAVQTKWDEMSHKLKTKTVQHAELKQRLKGLEPHRELQLSLRDAIFDNTTLLTEMDTLKSRVDELTRKLQEKEAQLTEAKLENATLIKKSDTLETIAKMIGSVF